MVARVCVISQWDFLILLASSTRQSSRYKDDLQTARVISSAVVKQKPKRKYRAEFPENYSESKVDTIFLMIRSLANRQRSLGAFERRERIEFLEKRIAELKESSASVDQEVLGHLESAS